MKDEGTQLLNHHAITTRFFFFRGLDPLPCREIANDFPFFGLLPIVAHPHGHQRRCLMQIRTTELWGQSEGDRTPGFVNPMGSVKRDALLDLLLTNKEELTGDVIINGSLHCSYYEITEFRILRVVRKEQQSTALETRLQLVQGTG